MAGAAMSDSGENSECFPFDSVIISPVDYSRPADMRALYHAGDWDIEGWDDTHLDSIVRHSFAFVAAVIPDGSWVGMGRLISDGVSDAYLQDIVVLPEWQGQKIGSAIVSMLLKICENYGISWIGTIAGPQTEYFYRRFGLAKMNSYTPMRYEK
jgi:GNAT superfamily N-acetyltransferase